MRATAAARLSALLLAVSVVGWALLAGHVPTGSEFVMLNASVATYTLLAGLARFGLLALTGLALVYWPCKLPLTSDLSAWHGSGTLIAAAPLAAVALYGFFVSLGGQKFFRGDLLGE